MAGSGRRTFAPGEVLTASNTMNYLMDQTVMNFAGTAARGSAIGTAVSEGMVSYLADSNAVEVYDGSAWNSLAYAAAVPTNAQNGFVPITPTSTNSNGGTVTTGSTGKVTFNIPATAYLRLNGVFSTGYDYYEIYLISKTGDGSYLNFKFAAAGTDISAGYYYITDYTDATTISFQSAGSNTTNGRLGGTGNTDATALVTKITVQNPYSTTNSKVVNAVGSYGNIANRAFTRLTSATAADGFTILPQGATTLIGQIKVYGVKA